jgi:hypothetical protein
LENVELLLFSTDFALINALNHGHAMGGVNCAITDFEHPRYLPNKDGLGPSLPQSPGHTTGTRLDTED